MAQKTWSVPGFHGFHGSPYSLCTVAPLAAQRHGARARAIADAVEKSLVSSGLEARLLMTEGI